MGGRRLKLLGKRKNTTLQQVPAEQVLFDGSRSHSFGGGALFGGEFVLGNLCVL